MERVDLCFLKLNIGNKYGLCSMLKKCPGICIKLSTATSTRTYYHKVQDHSLPISNLA
jgi:hypothetical protein